MRKDHITSEIIRTVKEMFIAKTGKDTTENEIYNICKSQFDCLFEYMEQKKEIHYQYIGTFSITPERKWFQDQLHEFRKNVKVKFKDDPEEYCRLVSEFCDNLRAERQERFDNNNCFNKNRFTHFENYENGYPRRGLKRRTRWR